MRKQYSTIRQKSKLFCCFLWIFLPYYQFEALWIAISVNYCYIKGGGELTMCKKICFFFLACTIIMSCLNGCMPLEAGATTAPTTDAATQTQPVATTRATTEATTQATTVATTAATAETTAETTAPATEAWGDMTYTVTNPYFSLRLPESWLELAIVKQTTGHLENETVNTLSFYERVSHPTSGGHVFTLGLWAEEADYTYLPHYRLLGTLTDSRGTQWKLVVMYPTDVQFEPQAAETYTQMSSQEDRILQTLTPAPGCSFTPVENSDN